MQSHNYIIDTNGKKTGIFIDLTHQKTDEIFNNSNEAQMEVLKLFVKGFPDEDLTLKINFVEVFAVFEFLQSKIETKFS